MKSSQQKADMIYAKFIKNCDSVDDALNKITADCFGELNEFTAKGLDGYMAYGNGEVLVYVDDEEEPFTGSVNNCLGYKTLCWD